MFKAAQRGRGAGGPLSRGASDDQLGQGPQTGTALCSVLSDGCDRLVAHGSSICFCQAGRRRGLDLAAEHASREVLRSGGAAKEARSWTRWSACATWQRRVEAA